MLERFYDGDCDANALSPQALAFIGDSVFNLFVKEKILCLANRPAKHLHQLSSNAVCCQTQSEAFKKIEPFLSDEEMAVYKRGRNAHSSNKPKNATKAQYHSATGLEALFGYLYIKGNILRLRELFCIMFKDYNFEIEFKGGNKNE